MYNLLRHVASIIKATCTIYSGNLSNLFRQYALFIKATCIIYVGKLPDLFIQLAYMNTPIHNNFYGKRILKAAATHRQHAAEIY